MLFIDKTLYLEISDAVACGLGTHEYLYKEKSRGARWGVFIKHPVYKNLVLLEYETLPPQKKALVTAKFGNPYDYYAKEPIRNMVTRDIKAEQYYMSYTYDGFKKLPTEKIESYTVAASWLNTLVKAQDDFKPIKQDLNITAAKFWLNVSDILSQQNVDLPVSYRKLMAKLDSYRKEGYESLVHKNYGNRHSVKIDCEVSEAVLIELISRANTDDILVCRQYNAWAAQNDKKPISESTVGNYRRKQEYLIHSDKHGIRSAYNKYGKHIQRGRPSAPLVLVEHDDNELDTYYKSQRTKNSRVETYYFNRFVIAVVIDAFNDYILGWAIAEAYTKDLIRLAYLDAVYHIKELTGDWYLPHQIRSDRFGLDAKSENDLGQFYKSLATFTPAAVKVARGKYIERSFGTTWHQVLGLYKNYAGHNITAKTKLNTDAIELNKHEYPDVSQAPAQAAEFINVMRQLVNDKTGLSKQEEWINAFNASEKSKEKRITEMQVIAKLGTQHTHSNKITNRGITPAINCVERTYEVPEEMYLQTIGKTVTVTFDPYDYSRILVTDNKGLMFIAREQELMPSAIADYKPGDRQKINDRLAEKVRHAQFISEKRQSQKQILERNQIDVESLIRAGIHSKAINHDLLLNYSPVPIEEPQPKKKIAAAAKSVDDVIDQF